MKKRRKKKKTVYGPPPYIEPSPEEYEDIKAKLLKYYRDKVHLGEFDGDIFEKTHQVLEECKKGWTNAPKTFLDRVRSKSKWNHGGAGNLITWGEAKRRQAAKESVLEGKIEASSGVIKKIEDELLVQIGRDQILKGLPAADKKFWKARERYYRNEFDFNESSDFALLMELLSDELEHKRIVEMRLSADSPEELAQLSKASTECFNRMDKAMKALGITREQRKDELDAGDGDIASLSVGLDKKKKLQEANKEIDDKERSLYLQKKHARGDTIVLDGISRPIHNRIPDMEQISKIEKEAGLQ